MVPLLDAVLKYVPPPEGDLQAPFKMLVSYIVFDKDTNRDYAFPNTRAYFHIAPTSLKLA